MRLFVVMLLSVVCVALFGQGAQAMAENGDVYIAILDADTMQPVEGASAVFLLPDQNWPLPADKADKVKFAASDASGQVCQRAEIGRVALKWKPFSGLKVDAKMNQDIVVHVEKDGYKPLTANTSFVVKIMKKREKPKVFLRDVLLAKSDSQKESAVADTSIRTTAVALDPKYGKSGQKFTVKAEVAYPRSLCKWISSKPADQMAVGVTCAKLWKGETRLKYIEPKGGDLVNGCVWLGEIASKAGVEAGVYPVDVQVLLRGGASTPLPGACHLVVAPSDTEAKDLYEKNVAPLEAK